MISPAPLEGVGGWCASPVQNFGGEDDCAYEVIILEWHNDFPNQLISKIKILISKIF